MIIESIDIGRFGKLAAFKASFEEGFNLIEGPAESGKTTLAAFITYMLYGFPAEEDAAFSERTLRAPLDGGVASGSMTFSAAGVRYRIERTSEVTERGWRDSYALFNLDTGLAEQGETSPGERFLGVSRESFLDTAFLNDVRRGGPSPERTSDAIENILFSGEEKLSSARAIRALTEASRALVSADGTSGDVAVLEKERALLKEQLAEETAKERLHFAREEELFITRKKMNEARAEVEKFSRLETNYYNALMIDDYDRLHTLEDSSDARVAAIRVHEDANRVEGFLPDHAYVAALSAANAEALACRRELADAEEALSALPEGRETVDVEALSLLESVDAEGGEDVLLEKARRLLKRERLFLALWILSSVLFAAFAGLFFYTLHMGPIAPVCGALAAFALGAVALFVVEDLRTRKHLRTLYAAAHAVKRDGFHENLRTASETRLRISHAASERERGVMRHSRAKDRKVLADKSLTDLLVRWGIAHDAEEPTAAVEGTLARAEAYLAEYERLVAEHRAAEIEVHTLRGKLEGQNEVAVRARVAPEDRKRFRNQNAKDLRRGIELYTGRLESLSATERSLTDALAAERRGESLAAIAEKILAIEKRIALLREEATVLAMAKDAVEGGAERLRAEVTPRLSLGACGFLYEMTDGKYSDISVGEDLSLTLDEGNGPYAVDYLSHSTEDLAYYALRLSLLSLMYREMPPISFDGCTARQDDERALSFLRAVRTLTEEGKQCFFFASGARERGLVGRVFSSYRHVKMPV